MKRHILQLNPILIPEINEHLASEYIVHKYFEISEKEMWMTENAKFIEAVITGGHTGISKEMLEKLPALKVVAINGVGTDAVNLEYCRSRALPVTATLGALTEDVADLAIGLLISTCRNICSVDRFVRAGQWPIYPQPNAIPLARRFSGMRIGIVGMGRVGRAVASRASAFGCPISYTDLNQMSDVHHRFVPNLINLAEDSDALILCASADKAEGIINEKVLDALGPKGFLINVARGRLVNEADLTKAISEGRIAGAGLDVFVDEPNVPSELRQSEKVTLQAHRASATWETRRAMAQMVLASIQEAFAGKRPSMSLTT
jgi:lactate dehydrogenase-like 2-hydroxyacid dehydrogenase